jgi:hypothetical protein
VEFVEGRIQVACLNAQVIEEDALVEGLVEVPADRIGAVGVGRFRVRHEIEGTEKHLGSYCQYCAGVGEACFGGDSFALNLAQLRFDP